MNPINDEMPSKDSSTDVPESEDKIKETKLDEISNDLKENEENIAEKLEQTEEVKIKENENGNIEESKNNENILEVTQKNSETINEETNECNVIEKSTSEDAEKKTEIEMETETETDLLLETDVEAKPPQNPATTEDKEASMESEAESENETEEFEEDVEDVEIPGEEEVDEIIVPDEGEAEDLTDGKDNEEEMEKSLNGDMEDEEETSLRYSEEEDDNENDSHLHEEETTKSSDTAEKDDFDKKSLHIDNSSKDSEEEDLDNLGAETEIAALEEDEDIHNDELILEEPKSNESPNTDDDADSRATYDPLNCTDNKEQDEEDTEIVTNIDDENSNESQSQDKERDEEEEEAEVVKNAESENSNDSTSKEKEQDDEDNEVSDINKNAESENSAECPNEEKNSNEEDDEVLFVETRNSPICIESDEDEGNSKDTANTSLSSTTNKNEDNRRIITTATAAVTVTKNATVTRTSARKSTAKFQQTRTPSNYNSPSYSNVPQIQNKTKSFDYLLKARPISKRTFTGTSAQQIVDCIELLDSSDDEAPPSRQKPAPTQQQKTPQKRTLLAAKGNYYKNKNNSKIAQTVPKSLPSNFTPYQIRQQPKKAAPPPLPPPTPQSNFLNAVQLQPAAVTGPNPPAFSALLSNKNVIIPNAFYGNPPNIRSTPDSEIERRFVRWLENFINQFCKPQFEPTHSCFVFLQRALKYRDFVRIKALRGNMNTHVQSASNQLNITLIEDLKTIFFKNRKVTNCGRRFCEFTCSAVPGKSVALISHRISGKVTLKTCNMDLPKSSNPPASSSAASSSSQSGTTSLTRKRQLEEDEDEYTPDKPIFKTKPNRPPSENGDDDSGDTGDDRKRSLRTKRTKRIDNNFSYNEDDLLAEYEIEDEDDEKLAQVEIQRKIEQKRLEAQKQRQQQAKSFESAFIQAFAKTLDEPTTSTKTKNNPTSQRIRLKNTTTATVTSIKQYTANNDAEDLLQATWIENVENDNTQVISDDDEPQEHRIYKQQQLEKEIQKQQQQYYSLTKKLNSKTQANPVSTRSSARSSRRNQEEVITGDDDYDENNCHANNSNTLNIDPLYWPKNVDSQMYVTGKNKDRCVICHLNCQRLVHHYVNEHRGCETYNSRLSASQINKLKQLNSTASVSLYKNGQFLYEAFCIFCQKNSRFMLRYWYQHYTMHTGEYAYRCTGCGIRKPTQSLLTQHHSQGCPEINSGAGGIVQDYSYDPKSLQIEAKICTLCNYLQLHRSNIVKHLHTQHSVKQILPKHIQTVVLMKIPPNTSTLAPTPSPSYPVSAHNNRHSQAYGRSSTSYIVPSTYVIEDEDTEFTYEEILPEETQPPPENHYYNYIPPYMQAAVNSGNFTFESVDAGDDLSFMICGMLDVEMNPDANSFSNN